MDAVCPRCGARMECRPGLDCWCEKLPRLPMPKGEAACLCEKCLAGERDRAARRNEAAHAAATNKE